MCISRPNIGIFSFFEDGESFATTKSRFPFRGNEGNECLKHIEIKSVTAVGAHRALIDFTLSNARRFYSSMENPLAVKGL